ncbi:prokaryotic transcription elongation factor, GreA/GreB domain protein [Hoylesella marshii DSM 16973 = JCM 13450]|uniref:Transcription elongation factor GreA n=2 Tax=Hoylesella marshii TaxID=189722 RepID=E0NUQ3_9BACT|nr:prokaryotic transcription elongation factor, GreA/GreB domain protein [Hoylesella marshii DSM 16973 = JCM 13450]
MSVLFRCTDVQRLIKQKAGIRDSDIAERMSEFFILLSEKKKHKNKKIMAYMSQEGYDKMIAELQRLEAVERPKISAAIAEARDKGDLSENSEYEAAKEAQAHLEDRINKMKRTIAEAKIVDTSRLSNEAVQILSKVEMTNLGNKAKMTYTIVSENEANLKEGKIAITTPIAQGLLNKKVGDEVEIAIPRGTIKLRIDKISIE